MAVLLPECDDGVAERLHAGRLHPERTGPGVARGGRVLLPVRLAQHQDGDGAERGVGRDPIEDRGRLHVGQMEIEDDERGPRRVDERRSALEERERLATVHDGMDDEGVGEDRPRGPQEPLVVVHHQDVDHRHATPPSAGRRSVKQLPRPGADSTAMVPRCASATRLTIARPTPLPATATPSTTCSDSGTRPNTSKMLRWYASGMPMPLSRTESVARPSSTAPFTSIRPRPAGTYFTAF